MNEVNAKTSKVSLLQFVISELEAKGSKLLNWTADLSGLQDAIAGPSRYSWKMDTSLSLSLCLLLVPRLMSDCSDRTAAGGAKGSREGTLGPARRGHPAERHSRQLAPRLVPCRTIFFRFRRRHHIRVYQSLLFLSFSDYYLSIRCSLA
jgi:hypothetical protein